MTAYYSDEAVTLYHGDCREVLPMLALEPDCTITDPPYGETSLAWDRWPDGWPSLIPGRSLWCFGSMRMFLDRCDEFAGWRFAQDIVWEKQDGSGFVTDRFRRVHEVAAHWYRGPWDALHRATPRDGVAGPDKSVTRAAVGKAHHGVRNASAYVDDGTRLVRSVLRVQNMHGKALVPTQKPLGILAPLVTYSVPEGGLVLDPFAGSGSTLAAAKADRRRAVGSESDEETCEIAARRLAQGALDFGAAS